MSKASMFNAPLRAIAALLLVLTTVFAASRAVAQPANSHPPERMTYQGYLVDSGGIPLATNAPKNYDLIFRIWNDSSATAVANRLWTEQQTVTVDKGYFSVLLGEGSGIGEARPELSTLFTNANASDRWVGITVKGIGAGGTDVNILPRLRLLTSPYAFLARGVSGAGVVGTNNLAPNIGLWTANGADVFRVGGNVGIGTPTPGAKLDVVGGNISIRDNTSYGLSLLNAAGAEAGTLGRAGTAGAWSTDASPGDVVLRGMAGKILLQNGSGAAAIALSGNAVGIGTSTINGNAKLQVAGGAIMPSAGGGASQGIEFPPDPFGGSLDRAYLKYWSAGSESGRLELGIQNDADDHILLMPSGNVGIGNTTPGVKLDVAGSMRVDSGGVAAPANGIFGSSGTRLTLWPGSASDTPYGFGIANGTLWSGVPASGLHRWFCGTGSKMILYNNANLEIFDGAAGVGGRLQVGTGGWSDVAVSFKANPSDNYMLVTMDKDNNLRHLFAATGVAYKTGAASWATWSDVQLKRNVQDLHGALDQLLGLRSVTFEYLDGKAYGEGMYRGFVAQEVEKVFPDWVSRAPDGMKAVECRGFESLTVEALRELRAEKDAQLKKLSDENTALRAALSAQEQRLSSLEALIRQAPARSESK